MLYDTCAGEVDRLTEGAFARQALAEGIDGIDGTIDEGKLVSLDGTCVG